MQLFKDSPSRQELNKNFLDQVILRFDFPIIFGLADTDQDGRLVTARKSDLLQSIRDQLIAKFPVYEPVETKSFNFELSNSHSPQVSEAAPSELIHSFKSLDKAKLCEVSISNFVFASKGGSSYTNFEDFLNEFWEIWERTADKLKIPTITKVGFRKINVFPFDKLLSQNLENSIKKEFLPPLGSDIALKTSNFVGRQTFDLNDNWKCKYHYGIYPRQINGQKAYFFDTDIFRGDAIVPNQIKDKLKLINSAHWELYWNSLHPDFFEQLKVKKNE